jgi:hypothetical protein
MDQQSLRLLPLLRSLGLSLLQGKVLQQMLLLHGTK